MSCQNFHELLSAELDNELSPEEKNSLEEHLAECPACRSLRQRLARMETGFAQLPELAPPPLRPRALPPAPRQSSAGVALVWSAILAAAACAAFTLWPISPARSNDGLALYLSAQTLQAQPPGEGATAVTEFRSGPLYGQALRGRRLAFEIGLDSHQHACRDLQLEVDYDFDNDGKVDRSEVYAPFHTDSQDGWEIYRSEIGGYSHEGEIRDFTGGTVAVRLRNATSDLQLLQGASRLVLPYRLNS